MAEFVESLGEKPIPPYQREIMEWLAKDRKISEAAMRHSPHQAMLDKIMIEKRNEYVDKCMIAAQTGWEVRVWIDDCAEINCSLENLQSQQHSPAFGDSGPGEYGQHDGNGH